jgi:glycosyltransferase 2 family protein
VKKQTILAVGKHLLGPVILVLVLWYYGPGLVKSLQNPLQIKAMFACAVIYMFGAVLTFFRWYILVRAQDLPLTLYNAMRLGLVGFFFSAFLPSSIGGDIVKAAMIAREQERRTVAVSTVLFDRAIGLWGLVWVIVLLGTFFWASGNPVLLDNSYLRYVVFTSSIVIGMSLVGWMIVLMLPANRAEIFANRLGRIPKLGHMLGEFWRAMWMYRLKQGSVVKAIAISICSHICFVLAFFFASQMFADPSKPDSFPTLSEDFLIVPLGTGLQALFPTPGGMGAGETGYGFLYTKLGKSGPDGVLASMAQRSVVWILSLTGFVVYLCMKPELPTVTVNEEIELAGKSA